MAGVYGPLTFLAAVCIPAAALAVPPDRLPVVIAGPPADIAAVCAALDARLGPLGVVVAIEPRPVLDATELVAPATPPAGSVGRAWIDLRDPARAAIYFLPAGGDRVAARSVPVDGPDDEVARAEMVEIVVTALGALRAPGQARPSAGIQGVGAGPAEPTPATPLRFEVGAIGSFAAEGVSKPTAGGGVTAFLGRAGGGSVAGLWFDLRVSATRTIDRPHPTLTAMRLGATSAALTGLLRWPIGTHLQVGGALGLAVSLRHARPILAEEIPALEQPRDQGDTVIALRAAARLDWVFGERFAVFAAALLDVPARQARYVVTGGEGTSIVFEPPLVVPAALVGLVFRLCSGQRC